MSEDLIDQKKNLNNNKGGRPYSKVLLDDPENLLTFALKNLVKIVNNKESKPENKIKACESISKLSFEMKKNKKVVKQNININPALERLKKKEEE